MVTTRMDLKRWFFEGQDQSATHMIVACDSFSHEDYPVYVTNKENVRDKASALRNQRTTTVMEVYDLAMDVEEQLNEYRAFHS